MRLSRYYAPTLKESPAEAEVVSHKLLLRAGMIRKLTAGIYTYLPLGLRAINKFSRIVREEMDRAGALETLMPAVQPGDLWKESGRWEHYGKELLRFTDRHDRESCLGPTHEEVVTDLVRHEIRSYRQLPINLFQIQTKFRDEIRPRFGLMRGREFIMKDGYSFDTGDSGADASYMSMYNAYNSIFERVGLKFKSVSADSGSIGGSFSHEFMVLADTGEDTIVTCPDCTYAANLEKAETACPRPVSTSGNAAATSGPNDLDDSGDSPQHTIKTELYVADNAMVAVFLRQDRQCNEVKLKNFLGAVDVRPATPEEEEKAHRDRQNGSTGKVVDKYLADHELLGISDWIAEDDALAERLHHADMDRNARIDAFADLRQACPGDACPQCGAPLVFTRGIEVGHIFKLGLKYSKAMNATFLDENGEQQFMCMGCYGIGISRVIAASIEQNNDDAGIIFPPAIAPFEVMLINLNPHDEEVTKVADFLYETLRKQGTDVLYDDRDERPGVKFNDADLMGFPMQVTLGRKGMDGGMVETKNRRTGEKGRLSLDNFAGEFSAWRDSVWQDWGLKQP